MRDLTVVILTVLGAVGWLLLYIAYLFWKDTIRRWKRDDKTIECLRGVLKNIGRDMTILDMEAYAKDGLNYGNKCPCASGKLYEDCCAAEYEKYHVG